MDRTIDTDLLLPRKCIDRHWWLFFLIAHLSNVLVKPLDLLFELFLYLIDIDILIVRQLWSYRFWPTWRSLLCLELLGLSRRSLFRNGGWTGTLVLFKLMRGRFLTIANFILLDGLRPALFLSPSLLVLDKSPFLLERIYINGLALA